MQQTCCCKSHSTYHVLLDIKTVYRFILRESQLSRSEISTMSRRRCPVTNPPAPCQGHNPPAPCRGHSLQWCGFLPVWQHHEAQQSCYVTQHHVSPPLQTNGRTADRKLLRRVNNPQTALSHRRLIRYKLHPTPSVYLLVSPNTICLSSGHYKSVKE